MMMKINLKNYVMFKQRGAVTLLVSFFVLTVMMLISFTAASVMTIEIRMSRDIANSIPAFFAADAGAEKCWYQVISDSVVGECDTVGTSFNPFPPSLDNGAIVTATRFSATELRTEGDYKGTQRNVSLTWDAP